jgi:glutamate--cysteine ligase
MRAAVPRQGLATQFAGATLRDLAREVVAIAEAGLRARGSGEEVYLAPLHDIAGGAPTQAEHWLARYSGAWAGDVTRIFAEAEV